MEWKWGLMTPCFSGRKRASWSLMGMRMKVRLFQRYLCCCMLFMFKGGLGGDIVEWLSWLDCGF